MANFFEETLRCQGMGPWLSKPERRHGAKHHPCSLSNHSVRAKWPQECFSIRMPRGSTVSDNRKPAGIKTPIRVRDYPAVERTA